MGHATGSFPCSSITHLPGQMILQSAEARQDLTSEYRRAEVMGLISIETLTIEVGPFSVSLL